MALPSCEVIIPTRLDNLEFLGQLLSSISLQSHLPQRVTLVVSGKPMHILTELVESFKSVYQIQPYVSFVYDKRPGLGLARNIGISNSSCDILLFGDDDDLWDSRRIEKVALSIANQARPSLIRHLHSVFPTLKPYILPKRYLLKPSLFISGLGNLYGGGSHFAGSSSIFKALLFNESLRYCEDWEFWLRVSLANIPIVSINEPLVHYRMHQNRMTSNILPNNMGELLVRQTYIAQSLLFTLSLCIGLFKLCVSSLAYILFSFLRGRKA